MLDISSGNNCLWITLSYFLLIRYLKLGKTDILRKGDLFCITVPPGCFSLQLSIHFLKNLERMIFFFNKNKLIIRTVRLKSPKK